jgi:hypothetical protein
MIESKSDANIASLLFSMTCGKFATNRRRSVKKEFIFYGQRAKASEAFSRCLEGNPLFYMG